MSIGYYVRKFPKGTSGVAVNRTKRDTVIVVDSKLTTRQGITEALPLLTDREIKEWLRL